MMMTTVTMMMTATMMATMMLMTAMKIIMTKLFILSTTHAEPSTISVFVSQGRFALDGDGVENDKTSIDGIENDKNKHNQILSAKERFFSLGPHHSYPV